MRRLLHASPWSAAALLLLLGCTLPLGWALDAELRRDLARDAAEADALPLLEILRGDLSGAVDDLLSGENLALSEAAQLLQKARAAAAEAKLAGHRSRLILDPRLDIYHLAYLSTVKLPERLALEVELASIERARGADKARAAYLREALLDAWQEEDRALGLALDGSPPEAQRSLQAEQQERRVLLDEYRLGERLLLRELAREDLEFWMLCDLRLEARLRESRQGLLAQRRLRWGLGAAMLSAMAAAIWILRRRSSR